MTLQCWSQLQELWAKAGVTVLPYQIETAKKVIYEMNGRAILADEVGLGKTIEAGLVIKELIHRDLAKTVLVLTPTSLLSQWESELREKFALTFAINPEHNWRHEPFIIASLDLVKREPRRSILAGRQWDLVIVDEAHHLKNRRTLNYQLVRDLQARRLLLISATPLQNDLTELYSLVSLVHQNCSDLTTIFGANFSLTSELQKIPG